MTDFYKNYKAADGHHTKCIPCAVELARENRAKKKQSRG